MRPSRGRIVFTSGPGGSGPPRPPAPASAPEASRPPGQHDLRVRREKAGRGGKTVTTAGIFYLTKDEAAGLLLALKKKLGSGGHLRPADAGWIMEIQGDHAEFLVAELTTRGFRAKRAGG